VTAQLHAIPKEAFQNCWTAGLSVLSHKGPTLKGLGIVTTQIQNFVFPAQGRILFGQSSIRQHVAVDDIIEKFKGEVILQQYIPNKENSENRFGIQFYKP
jgi:hypothetical protein